MSKCLLSDQLPEGLKKNNHLTDDIAEVTSTVNIQLNDEIKNLIWQNQLDKLVYYRLCPFFINPLAPATAIAVP